jgi:hypothetical protein
MMLLTSETLARTHLADLSLRFNLQQHFFSTVHEAIKVWNREFIFLRYFYLQSAINIKETRLEYQLTFAL